MEIRAEPPGRCFADALTITEPYIQNCARIIDGIHLNVLTAIALRRKKDERWREAIDGGAGRGGGVPDSSAPSAYTARRYCRCWKRWTGTATKHGAKRLMAAVRTQAAFYPHFEPCLAPVRS